jgi:[ribosomal protein S18]-alanine N-acetyltransferase
MLWLVKPPFLFSNFLLRATSVLREAPRQPICSIRQATQDDVDGILRCNIATLPENYPNDFYLEHLRLWPQMAFVAETFSTRSDDEFDNNSSIVGYVLGRMEQNPPRFPSDFHFSRAGHITSIAVLPSWRRRGIAQGLMKNVHEKVIRYAVIGVL